MKKAFSKFIKTILPLGFILLTMFPSLAKANYIYSYTGNPFLETYHVMTQIDDVQWEMVGYTDEISLGIEIQTVGLLTTSSSIDNITSLKIFTTSLTNPTELIYPGPTPDEFNPQVGGYLNIGSFSADGLPSTWNINLNRFAFYGGRGHFIDMSSSNLSDSINGYDEPFVTFEGEHRGQPGSWKVSVSPVPEPETYGMLILGLGVVGFVTRRRNQVIKNPIR
ncbi:MAG: PEP-CTERM sorting domain-containing protein [Methylotenera sp.]|uniref:PEP-CTERM sorting domain-containing protein n=1 Tax=Methylotenera sp. TaxID=2051956 RepID=UPI002489DB01|nr:PEP-CTERM sorting domain-containing protein [Methylotenera sp.]MDI1308991.1 PEP-CTERM sorting domain-containing protein [Methylotenera sp.]